MTYWSSWWSRRSSLTWCPWVTLLCLQKCTKDIKSNFKLQKKMIQRSFHGLLTTHIANSAALAVTGKKFLQS